MRRSRLFSGLPRQFLKSRRRHLSVMFASTREKAVGSNTVIDLRSDTLTKPSKSMMDAARDAPLGDDVYGEDPVTLELQDYMADLVGMKAALYVPTGTMANLTALLSHCHGRASEAIIGSSSHISLWEGGHAATIGGIHTRQLREDPDTVQLHPQDVRDAIQWDNDDHWTKTQVLCLENTHNMMGGVALPKSYFDEMGQLCHGGTLPPDGSNERISVHVDGARIMNAVVALETPIRDLCEHVDSVSICFSKGLGAPLGSILVGRDVEFIRLAKRARKRCGGGMRQAGVVAAMGLYAIQHNVERLAEDHDNATRLGKTLKEHEFVLPRNGAIDTNIVFFALPSNSKCPKKELLGRLRDEFGIKITGGYGKNGDFFRICTHMDVTSQQVDAATEAILKLCVS